jgi:hypothetical protein
LSEGHGQKLVPAGETLLLIVAAIAAYAFLEFVPGQVIHDLGEDSLASIHAPLSSIVADTGAAEFGVRSAGKESKSKNSETGLNCLQLN